MKFVSESIDNVLRKGENAGYHHFLLFQQCFQKPSSRARQMLGLCGYGLIPFFKEPCPGCSVVSMLES